uniref:Protein MNN4-like n=1 Tax=Caenorhabditis tropicalis TaxID=1561998 RepID=A0A1I7U3G5_9PELO
MSEEQKKKQMIHNLLNRKRKMDMKIEEKEDQKPSTSSEIKEETEEEIEEKKRNEQKYEKAKKALLFEAKRAKERADEVGPQGYLKPKSLGTNKEFLRRTIESTMPRRKKPEQK